MASGHPEGMVDAVGPPDTRFGALVLKCDAEEGAIVESFDLSPSDGGHYIVQYITPSDFAASTGLTMTQRGVFNVDPWNSTTDWAPWFYWIPTPGAFGIPALSPYARFIDQQCNNNMLNWWIPKGYGIAVSTTDFAGVEWSVVLRGSQY